MQQVNGIDVDRDKETKKSQLVRPGSGLFSGGGGDEGVAALALALACAS